MQLDAVLSSMGLDLSFTDDADFSGMTDVPAKIDSVLQESFIGVDENGVEAAAYTMVSVKAAGIYNPVELETVEFHLTRPFLYAIESYDGTVLFIGTVTAPNAPETAHK
jgi:serpin B